MNLVSRNVLEINFSLPFLDAFQLYSDLEHEELCATSILLDSFIVDVNHWCDSLKSKLDFLHECKLKKIMAGIP